MGSNKRFQAKCLFIPVKCAVDEANRLYEKSVEKKKNEELTAQAEKAQQMANEQKMITNDLMSTFTGKNNIDSNSESKGRAIFIIAGVVLLIVILMLVWNG